MKRKLYLPYILLFINIFFLLPIFGADGKYHVDFYDQWTDKTSRQLTDLARKYLDTQNMTDSALVCYTIVANRYYEHKLNKDELYLSVNAMANLGYLYGNQYFDYQKAYSYLKQSLDIAEKEHFDKLLSYIYLNLGVLSGTYEEIIGHDTYSKETVSYLNKAYNMSIKNKEWRAALYCWADIIDIKFNEHKDIRQEILQLKDFKGTKEPSYQYTKLLGNGMEAYARKDYQAAFDSFYQMGKSCPSSEKGNKDVLMLKAMRYQAAVLDAQGKQQAAINLLKKIAKKAEDGNMGHVEVWIYKIMYEYFDSLGQKDLANIYQLKYYKTKEHLSISGHIENMGQMQFLYQLKTVNDKVKALSIKRQQQQIIFIISTIALITIIIALILSLRYYQRKKTYIQNLYDKNMALLQLQENRKPNDNQQETIIEKETQKEDNEKKEAPTENNERYATSYLDDKSKEELLNRISAVMKDTKTICSPDFSIKQLSEMIESNTTYVSQVINEKYNMNFRTILNERRIAIACKRLSDTQHYGQYTIEAIATSVGFKSRTNFALVFKKITGLSASEFQRAALNKKA